MKKVLAWLLILCLLPGVFSMAESPAEAFVHLPAAEQDSQSPSGLKTTWSCVYFGAYPSAEVVDSTWDAVDASVLQDGDLIRDDALYDKLQAADWQNGSAEVDGRSYLRVGLDSAPAAGGKREQHYVWSFSRPWHYFLIQPIRWRVLDIQNGSALLLADRMPDCVPFHTADTGVSWEKCTLRSWLNGYGAEANEQQMDYSGNGWIDRAFTDAEREAILPVRCENPANPDYGTSGGDDTEDKVFILSCAEVFAGPDAGRYGFFPGRDYDDPAKRFTSTLYAKCMGAWWSPVDDYAGNSFWMMRTSGYTPQSVTYICDFGFVYSRGTLVTCSDAGVLPALWVDLDKAALTSAGEAVSTEIMRTRDPEENAFPVPDISGPLTVADDTMPGGRYTVWNAVAFGHYPQTEILKETGDPALSGPAESTETDPLLYGELEAAAAVSGDRVTFGGIGYVRLDGRWFRCDPIVWRVLEVADGTALLMADRCLDSVPFHAEYTDVYWENSGLRSWLNGTSVSGETPWGPWSFPEIAFTEDEFRSLVVSAVPNTANYYFGTSCGSGTHDRVFILSEEEVFCSEKAERFGFLPSDALPDPGRQLAVSAYAAARGAWQSGSSETAGRGFWLLRTNGYTRDNIVYVGEKGYLYNRGIPVTCEDAGIVPAVRIRLGACPVTRVEDISTGKK